MSLQHSSQKKITSRYGFGAPAWKVLYTEFDVHCAAGHLAGRQPSLPPTALIELAWLYSLLLKYHSSILLNKSLCTLYKSASLAQLSLPGTHMQLVVQAAILHP